jgi:hypothetical protein
MGGGRDQEAAGMPLTTVVRLRTIEKTWVGRIIIGLNDLWQVLRACRISALSVAIGFLLFAFAPQARDLFLDIRGYAGPAGTPIALEPVVLFVVQLLAAFLLLWAIPIHEVARRSLDRRLWCERLYGHPVGRRLVHLDALERWLPRLLGLACFAVIFLGLWLLPDKFDGNGNSNAAEVQISVLSWGTLIAAALFLAYAVGRRAVVESWSRRTRASPHHRVQRLSHHIGSISLFALVLLLFAYIRNPTTTWAWAGSFGALVPTERAFIVPLILGAWVPLLAYVTSWSYAIRLPLVFAAVGALVLINVLRDDGHQVRLLDTTKRAAAALPAQQAKARLAPLEIGEAIALWKRANGCGGAEPARPCPPPLIVAAAGGASRAAFMTAATLGILLDTTCERPTPDGACLERPVAANRLFAISAVSGSATGTAFFAAALANAVPPADAVSPAAGPFRAPCASGSTKHRFALWYRDRVPTTWRDCLQAIASEDFLSRTVIGLAFRDQVPFVGTNETDRAALLENAWIAASAKAVQDRGGTYRLSDPFHVFAPSPEEWRPLLVMNGTSATTGRRILTSHLSGAGGLFVDAYDYWDVAGHPSGEMIDGVPVCRSDPKPEQRTLDLSLATAATNSARFPVVSPPGALACRNVDERGRPGTLETHDRILDGGYFENFGATSALEIAEALRTAGLDPVVLLITNDPASGEAADKLIAGRREGPRVPNMEDRPLLGWATVPASGLFATRSARGSYTVANLEDLLAAPPKPFGGLARETPTHLFHVAVEEELNDLGAAKEVSMSWWLSKPVQEFLDRQLGRDPASLGRPLQVMERRPPLSRNEQALECLRRAILVPSALADQSVSCGGRGSTVRAGAGELVPGRQVDAAP